MELNPGQLAALVAIADEGSFEAAARRLQLTPSAVSQRIRALETAAGRVLVSRTQPCEAHRARGRVGQTGPSDGAFAYRGRSGARGVRSRRTCGDRQRRLAGYLASTCPR
ncbi:MAG: LysR family transcriptional regulator [Nocardioides sp.]